jgi:hypothetical protein
MHREPHMTDRSNVQHTIGPGPASFSPDPSQHTARADGLGRPDAPRTWRKPPHILWRKLRAVFIPVGDEDDSLYGYAREPAPSGWMYGAAIVLALFALICATLSSGLFSKRDDAVALALQSAEGTITSAAPSSSLRQSLSSSLLKAMPSAPSKPLAAAASPGDSHGLSAGGQIAGQVAGQTRPETRVAAKQNVATTPAVPHPRSQADLQVVRASMDKNNLTTARAVLSRVLAEQPNNIDAIKLNADLEDRELKRNALLLAARGCAEQDQWNCVWRNAGNALVTDASSAEAKRLVTQAMWQSELNTRTGATPPLGIGRAP